MSLPAKTPTTTSQAQKRSVTRGVFSKCRGCGRPLTSEQLAQAFAVCPHCDHHHLLPWAGWRELLLDDGVLDPWDDHVRPADPLCFDDGTPYRSRVDAATRKTSLSEAIQVGRGAIEGRAVAFGCFSFEFMGGSMGSVVGERMTRMFERALDESLPVVLLHASGGARMQEGILSLMQMAKAVAALGKFRAARRPYISVLLHPTTGGVAASTALLGDVNVAESGALIGFAGPRVIENTIRTKLPAGFQRPEFLLDHGMIDIIAKRTEMRATIAALLDHLCGSPS